MNRPTTGLVLGGAVAKGAFHAGAVSVLAERGVAFNRICGASSGALSAVVLAAGVATGRVALAAEVIETTWRDHAGWCDAVAISPKSILQRQGLSSVAKVRARLLGAIDQVVSAGKQRNDRSPYPEIEFRVVGTDLGTLGPSNAATRERTFTFRGEDFNTAAGRERIALAAAASAAFPGLFAPVLVEEHFIADGGALDNTPISYLIEPEHVDRVIVVSSISAEPAPMSEVPRGVALFASLLETMVDDRLSRDVRSARRANARLASLAAVLEQQSMIDAERRAVVRAVGLRHVSVVEIRPVETLAGTPFSGFGSAELRASYIETGKERARASLGAAEAPRELA